MNISLSPEILFYIGSFAVTNTFFWSVILSLFLIVFSLVINRSLKNVPSRLQGLVELVIEGAFTFVRNIIGDDDKARRVFPLVFTMFIFILTANLAVYIPGQSALTIDNGEGAVPLFRAVMSDYSLVFVMTMITIIITQVVAIMTLGPFGYISKFINLRKLKLFFSGLLKGKVKFGLLAQGFLDFFLGLMDIVGELSKVISLSFRLFGNIFAGEVLAAVMLFLLPFFAPLPFLFLGLLTAIVQAFVFSVLTLIFISMASDAKEDAVEEAV